MIMIVSIVAVILDADNDGATADGVIARNVAVADNDDEAWTSRGQTYGLTDRRDRKQIDHIDFNNVPR